MSEQQIEGVPDGWRLVAIRRVKNGEWFIERHGRIDLWREPDDETSCWVYPVIEKIEQPKKYRPFANAAEFEPHRDRWVEYTSPNYGDCSMYRVSAYTSERVWLGPDNVGKTYKEAFHCLRFADGSPFGVEVTE